MIPLKFYREKIEKEKENLFCPINQTSEQTFDIINWRYEKSLNDYLLAQTPSYQNVATHKQ